MPPAEDSTPRECASSNPCIKTLEAIYVVNCQAKRYSDLASEKYTNSHKATAKAYSNRKKALYELKEESLIKLLPHTSRIDRHKIGGAEYYCPHFDHFCFHLPVDKVEIDASQITERKPLNDYTKDTKTQDSDLSTEAALKHLESTLELNANTFLPDAHIWYGTTRRFIGWGYLPAPGSEPSP